MTTLAVQAPVAYDLDEVKRKVDKAKALLILDYPFWGTGVAKRPIIYSDRVPTACMTAKGQMYINPAFAEPLTVRNLIFLLAHEAMHYMLCHSLRRGGRDAKGWNIAADMVINDTLIDAKVGDFIEGGVTLNGARDMSTEEVYAQLPEDGGGGGGGGNGGIGDDIGDPVDENGQPLDESEIHQLEAQAKIDAVQSAKAAKAIGKLPINIERMIDELINVKTPWHEILERYMSGKVKDGYSWRRPNRRFIHQNIYIPGVDYKPKMGTVVIGSDTSGSIDRKERAHFDGHIDRILEMCNPEKVYVVHCDCEVQRVDEYEHDDWPVKISNAPRGGGTAFEPVFKWIDDNGIEPEVVVYLTDGYGDQNHFTSKHETVWLTTAGEDFSWGTVIKFEMED